MKRVLFVDDEPNVLDGLRRMLYPLRCKWEMVFVASGREALERMAEREFDVLVTDLRMPEMGGVELLKEVVKLHPQVIRFVLSGTPELEVTLRSINLAHQFLAKPCDASVLRGAFEQVFHFRIALGNPALRKLIAHVHSLPSIPGVYWKLVRALGAYEISAKEVAGIVSQDMSMVAKVLQLANSACFGPSREIADPEQAVIYLGTDMIKALVLSAAAFSPFDPNALPGFSIDALQEHSLAVATLARRIAKSLQLSRAELDEVFTGGLLHDLGKLAFAASFPQGYREIAACAERDHETSSDAELRHFETTHAEVGSYLLWLWGLPDAVVNAVGYHHAPGRTEPAASSVAVVVHAADALIRDPSGKSLDMDCLDRLGLAANLPEWIGLRDGLAGVVEC